jgi:hypothetical protein
MPLWRKKDEEPEESQAERLRKFRNMYSKQYGSKPVDNLPQVGEPVRVQALCPICSEPMEGADAATMLCPAAAAEPELHDKLKAALNNWRGGQVQGKTVPYYNKTIGLMRQALKRSMERRRAEEARQHHRTAERKQATEA